VTSGSAASEESVQRAREGLRGSFEVV